MNRNEVLKTISNLKGAEGHKKVLEVYNAQKPLPRGYKMKDKDAWCAATVSAVLLMNGYSEISECSCPKMIEKAQKAGIWVEDDNYMPSVGDIVMYDWQDSGKGDNKGVADHVGIVIATNENKITVREGNKGGTLGNRTIERNGKYIRGYIVPRYEGAEAKNEAPVVNPTPEVPKAEEKPQTSSERYIVGKTYTVSVRSALNVRKGAGKQYATVGYKGLTADGRKHANGNGALLNGTKVTVQEVKSIGDSIWIRIPSGWVCGKDGNSVFVK